MKVNGLSVATEVRRRKSAMYELYQDCAFGNRLRCWKTVEELEASGFQGEVGLRSTAGGGGQCVYNVPAGLVREQLSLFKGGVHISEMAPHQQCGLFNVEVCLSAWEMGGIGLRWAPGNLPMRQAIARYGFRHLGGLRARLFLRGELGPLAGAGRAADLEAKQLITQFHELEPLYSVLVFAGGGLDLKSQENLRRLFHQYSINDTESYTVELSVFDRRLGELGWNTLFWEVRNY